MDSPKERAKISRIDSGIDDDSMIDSHSNFSDSATSHKQPEFYIGGVSEASSHIESSTGVKKCWPPRINQRFAFWATWSMCSILF